MIAKLYDRWCGPIVFPTVLVPWRGIRGEQKAQGCTVIAGAFDVSLQLLGYERGVDGPYERWPKFTIDDFLATEFGKLADSFDATIKEESCPTSDATPAAHRRPSRLRRWALLHTTHRHLRSRSREWT